MLLYAFFGGAIFAAILVNVFCTPAAVPAGPVEKIALGASIPLQNLLDHTVKRLYQTLACLQINDLTLLVKWGADGSSGLQKFHQKPAPNSSQSNTADEGTVFVISMVPLMLKGAIFEQGSEEVQLAFKFAILAHNKNVSGRRFELQAFVDVINTADAFKLSRLICGQFNRGVHSLIGAVSPDSFDTLHSYSNTFQVPFVTPWFPEKVLTPSSGLLDHALSMRPEYHQAVIDTINFYGWKKIIFIYESDDEEILHRVFVPPFGMVKITFTNTCLMAVMILASRPLLYSDFVDHVMSKFVQSILTVPALVHHTRIISPQFFSTFEKEQLLSHVIAFLNHHRCQSDASPENADVFIDILNHNENNELLCFVGNFIELTDVYLNYVTEKNLNLSFMNALSFLLAQCKQYVLAHRSSNLTQWHPILGWFSQSGYDSSLHEAVPLIKKQLSLLWTKPFISLMLENSLRCYTSEASPSSDSEANSASRLIGRNTGFGKKAWDMLADATNVNTRWIRKQSRMTNETKCMLQDAQHRLRIACALYHTVVNTFVQLRLDVLTGLCYQSDVLPLFWKYLLAQNDGLKFLFRYVSSSAKFNELNGDVNCQVLLMFSECMIHFITILDDVEMYEQQSVFCLGDFIRLSAFLNYFLYKGIVNEVFKEEGNDELTDQLFNNLHRLLMVLYLRNCRRTYTTSPTHWIIKEIKSNTFFLDLERRTDKAKFLKEKMPHVISYQERVHLLKKNIHLEKCSLKEQLVQQSERHSNSNFPLPVRLVKIRRNHIVEDAFHCLQRMSSVEMKHAFRVKFLNKEGLEEAGVDQAGIFKEFMVDLIKKLFDPSLNLFRRTSNGHVYPSPMSNVSETNHLDLIEFSGKMLAKAIYEGIVLDVRLASFFLSQILGQTQSTFYSYLDDLPSLDEELYRSLMYVKRYDGDVADLCLTFSTTEECFGTVLTRDLIPGGRVINVTNYNKIIYIHLMAHFRMHTQIKHQTVAFAKGFYSVLSRNFLSLFSVPELQLLISGEDEPLNFEQLRQHTQYYGGFHDSHKVIVWLWDILKNDFNEEERALFLKFVTSSSKPPVLGFAFLNPPFSIRCVEVGEDEDSGDSVGSVIRGFFTIRRKGPEYRLPTSSTCFNLLKLPNYSRKTVLRDKLRYAITANSGFELS